jgi:competence protein ComGC
MGMYGNYFLDENAKILLESGLSKDDLNNKNKLNKKIKDAEKDNKNGFNTLIAILLVILSIPIGIIIIISSPLCTALSHMINDTGIPAKIKLNRAEKLIKELPVKISKLNDKIKKADNEEDKKKLKKSKADLEKLLAQSKEVARTAKLDYNENEVKFWKSIFEKAKRLKDSGKVQQVNAPGHGYEFIYIYWYMNLPESEFKKRMSQVKSIPKENLLKSLKFLTDDGIYPMNDENAVNSYNTHFKSLPNQNYKLIYYNNRNGFGGEDYIWGLYGDDYKIYNCLVGGFNTYSYSEFLNKYCAPSNNDMKNCYEADKELGYYQLTEKLE